MIESDWQLRATVVNQLLEFNKRGKAVRRGKPI